ncbi:hypothetical protein BT96DRAFT_1097929 [Gymnopus androsaceus JB14]|uniref:DUF6570 domain-containing protein n=1 Tax=Gymnopus androsaceus JB14 TaxID=1447944 RepID=A0A6A4HN35_9AGAR|nr:hypothetical protein BT96DRAFT_1097929 [Gymnopus androsaceus JB14]
MLRDYMAHHPLKKTLFSCMACAHPWSPSDLNDLISIVFVGPRKLTRQELRKLFVRQCKISNIAANHIGCIQLPDPNENILNLFPEMIYYLGLKSASFTIMKLIQKVCLKRRSRVLTNIPVRFSQKRLSKMC